MNPEALLTGQPCLASDELNDPLGILRRLHNLTRLAEAFSFVIVPKKPWALERDSPIVSLLVPQGTLLRQPQREQMRKPKLKD